MKIEMLSVDVIHPNPWNPNEMDDETFNRLAEELEEVGYIDPIQVVQMQDNEYRIIGGEHRWRAMRVLGYEELECVVLSDDKWADEDLQKFVTTRLNALRGNLNPQKFMDLYMDLSDRYNHDDLQLLMGFTDKEIFDKMTADARKGLEDAGISKDKLDEFDEAVKEIKTVEDLSNIINRIFNENGDQLEHSFMWFGFGGKEHLYVQVKQSDFKNLKKLTELIKDGNEDAGEVFGTFIEKALLARK